MFDSWGAIRQTCHLQFASQLSQYIEHLREKGKSYLGRGKPLLSGFRNENDTVWVWRHIWSSFREKRVVGNWTARHLAPSPRKAGLVNSRVTQLIREWKWNKKLGERRGQVVTVQPLLRHQVGLKTRFDRLIWYSTNAFTVFGVSKSVDRL